MARQVQNLACGLRAHYIVENLACQVKNFFIEQSVGVLYNCFINRREPHMTDAEFFAQIQEDYFHEFVGTELREIFVCTDAHDEIFEFDDVPF